MHYNVDPLFWLWAAIFGGVLAGAVAAFREAKGAQVFFWGRGRWCPLYRVFPILLFVSEETISGEKTRK
jgi:hypothetical protein